jgi:hypothetical protein
MNLEEQKIFILNAMEFNKHNESKLVDCFLIGINGILSDNYHSMNAENTFQKYQDTITFLILKLTQYLNHRIFDEDFCLILIQKIKSLDRRYSGLTFRFIYQEIIFINRDKEEWIWDLIFRYCDCHAMKWNFIDHTQKEKDALKRALIHYQRIFEGKEKVNIKELNEEEAIKTFRMFEQII